MNKTVKTTLAVAASAAAIASVVSVPSYVSAWGDNAGGRKSYTYQEITDNAKAWGNKVVFNSISNSTIGDEKNFVGAREYNGAGAGKNNVWNGNDITVRDGQEYIIRLYVHNNNPNGAVSKNTRVAFNLPTTSAKQVQVNGFIFSDNATPSRYWDYVNFNSDNAFHLEYVYGSALLENNGVGKNGGVKLSDEIVTKAASNNGVQIGYTGLNGEVPGCYQYASYITIRVKAVFDTDYTIQTKVRVAGTTEWKTQVAANIGDKVEVQTQYRNTSKSKATQNNVMIKSILPDNLEYVAGSTKIYNVKYDGSTLSDGVTTNGVNIGNYTGGSNAYVRYTATVTDKNLACGSNTLVNWVQGGVGEITLQDYAAVVVNKPCENTPNTPDTPTKLPETGPEAVAGGVIAAGSIVTAAGYYIASRRSLR